MVGRCTSKGMLTQNSITHRVDHYWADVFKEKSQQGEFKYSVVQKLLSVAHGNADGEPSLTKNKRTVTPDRLACFGDLTIK